MRIVVTGDRTLTAELAGEAATIGGTVTDVALDAAGQIAAEWQSIIPSSPGGYPGAGFTGSPGANQARPLTGGPMAGAEAFNQSFVAWFLQAGTSRHGPKVDLVGAAEPHADRFVERLAEQVGDL